MRLWSDAFLDRRAMPTRCAFGRHRFYPLDLPEDDRFELSDNRSPHLAWEDAPENTKSFALICHDPDAPADRSGANVAGSTLAREAPRAEFVHWVLVDLPADTRELEEAAFSDGVTPRGKGPTADRGRAGINDFTSWFEDDPEMKGDYHGYDGPCPPWNDLLIHRYVFTLYALDVEKLPVEGPFRAADVRAAMEGHVLAEAATEGFYYINPEARFR